MTRNSTCVRSPPFPSSSGRSATNTPPRVLLAEDNDDMRALVTEALAEDGYEVVPASDGGRLLVRVARAYDRGHPHEEFDLIVSDVHMPVCDGFQILEELRRARWPTPAVMITAYADERTRARASALGAVLLSKPFDTDVLRRIARTMMALPDLPGLTSPT